MDETRKQDHGPTNRSRELIVGTPPDYSSYTNCCVGPERELQGVLTSKTLSPKKIFPPRLKIPRYHQTLTQQNVVFMQQHSVEITGIPLLQVFCIVFLYPTQPKPLTTTHLTPKPCARVRWRQSIDKRLSAPCI